MESITISGAPNFIFNTVDEFRNFFERTPSGTPKLYDNWREAPEDGWTISDDGRILQILKRAPIKGGYGIKNTQHKNGYVRTAIGTFFCDEDAFMDTDVEKHPSRYTFSGKKVDGLHYRPKCPLTRKERLWLVQIIRGADPYEAYETVFGPVRPEYLIARVTKLLSEARIMKALREEITAALESNSVTADWIVSTYKNIAEDPLVTGTARIAAVQQLREELESSRADVNPSTSAGALPYQADAVSLEVENDRKRLEGLTESGVFRATDEEVVSVADQRSVPEEESGEADEVPISEGTDNPLNQTHTIPN